MVAMKKPPPKGDGYRLLQFATERAGRYPGLRFLRIVWWQPYRYQSGPFIPPATLKCQAPTRVSASAFSAAVLITVRVAGSQQDLNLRPERLSPRSATNALPIFSFMSHPR